MGSQGEEPRPVIIGIYGLPGSGKTTLLHELEQLLGDSQFRFYEGSKVLNDVIDGGLAAFQDLSEDERHKCREKAIDEIKKQCVDTNTTAVVAGHFMFWSSNEEECYTVHTQKDLETYTHILYLDVPAETIARRRLNDDRRDRPTVSVTNLTKWQQLEKAGLRDLCLKHKILFSLLPAHLSTPEKVSVLINDFQLHNERLNSERAEQALDKAVGFGHPETMLVIDGDGTLSPEDTGVLFWEKAMPTWKSGHDYPLSRIFSSGLEYSYTAFRQAALLYEETTSDTEYDKVCADLAPSILLYLEFVDLLRRMRAQGHVGAVIITCGLRRVWEKVLDLEGLSNQVKVIGGNRISEGFVVTPTVKRELVARLQNKHKAYVCAFGDSPVDLDMLDQANEAIVVVSHKQGRSRSMDEKLRARIRQGLKARQVVMPPNALLRLSKDELPLVEFDDSFFESIFRCRHNTEVRIVHATDRPSASLIATSMRDARVFGPMLKKAHRRAGWYLATEFVADIVGLEECPIMHVLGQESSGHRLKNESQTLIVALMRAGEPMAEGVSDAFPTAMFLHAKNPLDLKDIHLEGQRTLILVDSVINSGKTVIDFLQRVRELHSHIRIVIVAGTLQAQAISPGSRLVRELEACTNVSLVALRTSETKFTGKGPTDTGHRLFNSTHLD